MRIILFGASGMVGQGVLRECLRDPDVDLVLLIGRSPISWQHPKIRQITRPDPGDLTPIQSELTGFDATFFCLGVSSAGMSAADYKRLTYDLTIRAARTLADQNPQMTFIYVS
ncbi:MAG: epimerase, partial [Acidobacteriota bacterium]|nr:epimerase [Acidobacteriota bacterium]